MTNSRSNLPAPPDYYDEVFSQIVENQARSGPFKSRARLISNNVLGRRVLDVGCGIAYIVKYLKADLYIGLDFSEFAIDYNSTNFESPWASFILDDVTGRGFHPRMVQPETPKFDTIIFGEILEHVQRPALLINKFLFFKPDRLIVTLPINIPDPSHYQSQWSEENVTYLLQPFGKITLKTLDLHWWIAIVDVEEPTRNFGTTAEGRQP